MMKGARESLQTDVAMMIGGPLVIATAFLRLGNNIRSCLTTRAHSRGSPPR
jgi:hypothetical protein